LFERHLQGAYRLNESYLGWKLPVRSANRLLRIGSELTTNAFRALVGAMKANSTTRLLRWERLALRGDFSAIPRPFTWDQSNRLAHFLNGYEIVGGMDRLAEISNALLGEYRWSGHWRGTALELWLCLFFQHRARRHMGLEEIDPSLDDLCDALGKALSRLSSVEAELLASHLSQHAI
jgi:hypothetical protein